MYLEQRAAGPGCHAFAEWKELAEEEMIRALDHVEHCTRQRLTETGERVDRADLVVGARHEQQPSSERGQSGELPVVDAGEGGSHEGQSGESGVPWREPRRHRRTEGVAGQSEGALGSDEVGQVGKGRLDVALLAGAAVVDPGGTADTAEIKAERGEPQVAAHLRDAYHDWVLHVAPVQGVGMADDDSALGRRRYGEASFENDTIAGGQRCNLFGYHTGQRIQGACCCVQQPC